ncbi:polyphosphate:nucleotide phosphotransferase, PPK2 family [Pseudarcicella hirudinis]|uniref:Polyphosphate:nucleotide phosphotransferase, PPK2 family n=1 Tax=Pseudarcicella hirudinis TaxID=1079859 RepID=A0A1I5XN24_9BACT|nr:PPK2 family polyphosphate kinase [Pseudarcicella hirudinis]SFQ33385.1 polyphosphate:nucleotide phosphotransferase, PPK2 family [Pseudarcicella hirudinis]
MSIKFDDFEFKGDTKFNIKDAPTKVKDLYKNDEDYQVLLSEYHKKIDALQSMMYAHDRYGMLLIFQASDAAGKDGTIKAVFSGINPAGVSVHSFKRPNDEELEHDFMWRNMLKMPKRGMLTVFNRSYYEEVLVVKVHPEILKQSQRIPEELTEDPEKIWQHRYEDISNYEKFSHRNGTRIIKFFLHVSKKEQGERLIERIQDPTKNWKFEEGDVKEREYWKEYQKAYEEMINQTASKNAPWYVVPADDKKNMRLIVAQIILSHLESLKMNYPEPDEARHQALLGLIETIKKQEE